jgi:hypothetical protein
MRKEQPMSSKLREALSKASIALSWSTHHHLTEDDAEECLAIVEAALAEPLRNCDVGTAEEQMERHYIFCSRNIKCNPDSSRCMMCYAKWSQMTYKEVK